MLIHALKDKHLFSYDFQTKKALCRIWGVEEGGGRDTTRTEIAPFPPLPGPDAPISRAFIVSPPSVARGVVPRNSWTRATPKLWDTKPMGRVSRITVHHDGMTPFMSTSSSSAAQRLESIRNAHVSGNGWADIGYHYVVDPAGRVWEARSTTLQGAHVKDNNEGNIGVMVMGNYEQQVPTSAASKSLDDFVASLMHRYQVGVGRVFTHREIRPTACPGVNLQRVMESTRSRGGALARA